MSEQAQVTHGGPKPTQWGIVLSICSLVAKIVIVAIARVGSQGARPAVEGTATGNPNSIGAKALFF